MLLEGAALISSRNYCSSSVPHVLELIAEAPD